MTTAASRFDNDDTLLITRMEEENVVVPIIAEKLTVGKRKIVTGGVRVIKRVTEREEIVDQALRHEDVQVERVTINEIVAEAPQARQEGNTWIVPILEEVLVVEKRLLLKEEVRITRTGTDIHQPQTVILRAEEVVVEEIAPDELLSQ